MSPGDSAGSTPAEPQNTARVARSRLPLVLALAWVIAGAALYAVEVLKLLSGLG